jgi:hypothetical protein
MRVNKARNHDPSRRVHRLSCPNSPHLGRRSDPNDLTASDSHGAVLDNPTLGVHRDDGAAGDEQVGLTRLPNDGPREQKNQNR